MMTELAKTAELVRGMVAAIKIPVTAKMRLGWDDDNLTAPDLVRSLEDAGIAGIFIHGAFAFWYLLLRKATRYNFFYPHHHPKNLLLVTDDCLFSKIFHPRKRGKMPILGP